MAIVFLISLGDGLGGASFERLAKQYILQVFFEPAAFGILMLLAILVFGSGQLVIATILTVIAGMMHPGYVAPGGVLIGTFLLHELFFARSRVTAQKLSAVLICVLGLAALAANALYLKWLFPPTDPQLHHQAYQILTQQRIPHHADPSEWLGIGALAKFAICLSAALLLPRGKLRFVIRGGLIAMAAFTAFAFLPDATTFRLVAPWRVSVVIVPLAMLALLALLVVRVEEARVFPVSAGRIYSAGSLVVIFCCALIGGYVTFGKFSEAKPHMSTSFAQIWVPASNI